MIASRSLLERVIARLTPQCESLVLNSNEDSSRFSGLSLPVISDSLAGQQGPLAGLLSGLDWVDSNCPGTEWVLSAPLDTPFLPADLVSRLHAVVRAADASIASAQSAGRTHHVIALWHLSLRNDLRAALNQGVRKVEAFTTSHRSAFAAWPTDPFDPFLNVNTPADLAEAERLALVADR